MARLSDLDMMVLLKNQKEALEDMVAEGRSFGSEPEVRITPQLFPPKQAAQYIGMSKHFLDVGRIKSAEELQTIEKGSYIPRPAHVKLSTRRVRYTKDELDRWIRENMQ